MIIYDYFNQVSWFISCLAFEDTQRNDIAISKNTQVVTGETFLLQSLKGQINE